MVFEAAYLLFIVLILAVFGAAAGAIGAAMLGWPAFAGTACLMLGICAICACGTRSVEGLFKWVSFVLYGVYALFVILSLAAFGNRIGIHLTSPEVPSGNWMLGGLTYAGYNVVGAVIILPVLRHLGSSRDALVAGVLAGPLAMIPALLFFICMTAFIPEIADQTLPSDFLLRQLNFPAFHAAFQFMIFLALLESGTGCAHAFNERLSGAYAARNGRGLTALSRLIISGALLLFSMVLAARFGLVTLIARGYRALAYVFLAVFVVPVVIAAMRKMFETSGMRTNIFLAATLLAIPLGWGAAGSVAFASVLPPPTAAATVTAPSVVPTAPSPAADGHALTAKDADAWLDGFMPYALRSGDIAGAVVVIVKNGAILTERGYGYADVATETPVDPKNTLFCFGSVSKLLTWTAVMQQVERGRLDLDADINRYLDFKIPERDGRPVTVRNLMTHTAGFEERLSGLIGVAADGVTPLGQFLKSYVPPRIFAPGETPAYSNYGAALAGYLVARVSGLSFDDYMDTYVLAPLAMRDSTFRQPLPARLETRLSKAYSAASLPPRPYEIVGPAPAGSLSSTGDDMAHFMIAHLQNGRYGAIRILENATAETMHGSALTILPGINRMELGFYEDNINGRRVIAHGGDTQWFHSDLHLFLDDGVGLLISVNSLGKDGAAHGLRYALFKEFADRYFPGSRAPAAVDAPSAARDAERIAGRYEASRRVDSTFASALYLLAQTTVQNNGDGTISVSTAVSPSGVPRKWREIGPLLWREDQSADLLSALPADGRITRFSFGEGAAIEMFDRVPWWRSGAAWLPLLTGALSVEIITVLAWPVSALTRRHYRVASSATEPGARAQRAVRLASLASALVMLGWLGLIVAMGSDLDLIAKSDGLILLLHILSPVVFPGTAGVGLWNASVAVHAPRRWFAKFWAISLALSLCVSLWAALTLHLIAFSRGF